ncbi:MlaD family protein [Patulibacter minatonensis]|uniref:MCE family protein n=1 Tax=Patulibacter minatonensis TaxID=298163 RepID=UPI00047E363E|nr:MlaD family protein [Patulibacter minatonensis]
MNKNRPHPAQIGIMIAFALSCFGLLLFLWTSFGGPVPLKAKPYEVKTAFAQGTQLAGYADVRVSGVTVGKVTKIVRAGGKARVTMKIDPKFAPLPQDTRATLRTKTLVGETFVDLSFGSRKDQTVKKTFIADGGTIPARNIQPTVELDQILDAFDKPTRADLKTVLTSLAKGTDGAGKDLNAAVGQVAPLAEGADSLFSILNRQSAEVQSGTRDFGTAFAAIGRREGAIQGIATSGRQLLETTSAITPALKATLDRLPSFARETRRFMVTTEATSRAAKPALDDLKPVTPLVRPALQRLSVLAPELRDTLTDLDPVLDRVKTGMPPLRQIVAALRPLTDSVSPVGEDLVPIAQFINAYKRELPITFANAGAAIQATAPDATGKQQHYLRVAAPINGETVSGATTRNPASRYSPYPRPGELELAGTGKMPSFACDHLGNVAGLLTGVLDSSGMGNPPCIAQQPFAINGQSKIYPRLQPVTPAQVRSGLLSRTK